MNIPSENTKEFIRNILFEGEAVVKFTKVDGTIREMPCTLKPELLPTMVVKEGARTVVENESVLRVFCTDKQEWRSFRVASVISIVKG